MYIVLYLYPAGERYLYRILYYTAIKFIRRRTVLSTVLIADCKLPYAYGFVNDCSSPPDVPPDVSPDVPPPSLVTTARSSARTPNRHSCTLPSPSSSMPGTAGGCGCTSCHGIAEQPSDNESPGRSCATQRFILFCFQVRVRRAHVTPPSDV